MNELVSPKQVARAIGVSESSLKRWCDRGLIPAVRTAGGHRKLPISGVISFLKSSGHALVEPEVIGLPPVSGRGERTLSRSMSRLRDALIAGDEPVCRQVLMDLYLAGNRISAITDEVISPAFEEIGELWDCGDVEVYQERRSCEICLRILHELRTALPPVPGDSTIAIGGTLEGDHYVLSTTAAEMVLRENGWRATSLGSSLTVDTLKAAIADNHPRLFWLSVSHITRPESFVDAAATLYETAVANNSAFVVGGRALSESVRKQTKYSAYCDTMLHLEAFAETLLRPT